MFRFEILPLTFPEKNAEQWKNLFKPCAAQRLFLPVNILMLFINLFPFTHKTIIYIFLFLVIIKKCKFSFICRHGYIIYVARIENMEFF